MGCSSPITGAARNSSMQTEAQYTDIAFVISGVELQLIYRSPKVAPPRPINMDMPKPNSQQRRTAVDQVSQGAIQLEAQYCSGYYDRRIKEASAEAQ
jgi:hypothetical protein